jgi:hypothetical protein
MALGCHGSIILCKFHRYTAAGRNAASCNQTRARLPVYLAAMNPYRIVQIGSLRTGWATEEDGIITRSGKSVAALGASLDAKLAGANEFDADDIAKAIAARPSPTYEERLAVSSRQGARNRRAIRSRNPELLKCTRIDPRHLVDQPLRRLAHLVAAECGLDLAGR